MALASALASAGSEQAWQVSSEQDVPGSSGAPRQEVRITAAPGETNTMKVFAATPERLVIHDQTARLAQAGPGCTKVNQYTAACRLDTLSQPESAHGIMWVELGDQSDQFVLASSSTTLFLHLEAGSGADRVESYVRRGAFIDGGPGNDRLHSIGDTSFTEYENVDWDISMRILGGFGDDVVDTRNFDNFAEVYCGPGIDTLHGDSVDQNPDEPECENVSLATPALLGELSFL